MTGSGGTSDRGGSTGATREHRIEIVQRFFADGYTAECPCGWRSEEMATQEYALAEGSKHIEDVGGDRG